MESSHPRGWPFTRNVFISPAPEAVAMHVVSGHSQGWSFTRGGGLRLRDPQHSASLRILLETAYLHCSGLSRRTGSRGVFRLCRETRALLLTSRNCAGRVTSMYVQSGSEPVTGRGEKSPARRLVYLRVGLAGIAESAVAAVLALSVARQRERDLGEGVG